MTQNAPSPIPTLIPDSAPFTIEQRTWLNGFFAGLLLVIFGAMWAGIARYRLRPRPTPSR